MVPYLRAANVTWRGLDFTDVKEMDFNEAEVATYKLKAGDILLAEASGSASEVGKPGVYPENTTTHCFQNTLIRVRADATLSRFLHLHFVKDAVLGAFARTSRGVGIHHLGAEALSAWEVSLPPQGEQDRIVDAVASYLSRLDAAVESLERVQSKLKAYRASVLRAAVEGRLVPTEAELARKDKRTYERADALLARILMGRRHRWEEAELTKMAAAGVTPSDHKWKAKYKAPAPPDTSTLPELPEGWCWAALEQVSDVQLGQQRAPVHAAAEEQLPYVRAANITWAGLDLSDVKKMGFPNPDRYRLRTGDVLLSEASGSPMEAGKPAIWRDQIPGACYQKTLLRVRSLDERALLPEYLRLVFLRDCVTGKFARLAPGVGIVHLTAERMLVWPIPLAPIDEQRRLVEEVERLESVEGSVKVNASRQVARVARLRQSVLKWAFEGKLVDQDPNDEPAEKLLARIRADRAATPTNTRGRTAKAAT
jgi:type I restriction enzyme S subunit